MQGQERMLRERFARLACVQCGSHHRLDDMLVLAQRESRWLVLLTCWSCQRRVIFVASFPTMRLQSPGEHESPPTLYQGPTTPDWLTSSALPHEEDTPGKINPYTPFPPRMDTPVTTSDVESIRRFLEGFNGDFRSLFGPQDGMAYG